MTAILNKLVSACQTIEANAGSGGGGGSSTEYGTSMATLTASSFASRSCYIPFGSLSENHCEAKIFIRVNNKIDRYYIEVVYDKTIDERYCLKVFKNTDAISDSTELSFGLVKCTHSAVEGTMICLKVGGIDTIESETFTVYKISTYKGHMAGDGDEGITYGSDLTDPRFISYQVAAV